ncbi:hypothetical protein KUCAC02_001281 [Chaenocephalus aceratus]|uniref:Uncharacterized protein n=1 Tax=Chaenocephalus aceratus TaxID=36190 RepID=A0ACB9XVV8_CHAAC|nr:hypothetical protein KUCAC02_001281 [Chaenocephalus aceratus]
MHYQGNTEEASETLTGQRSPYPPHLPRKACSDGSGGRAHCVPTGMPVAMATFELHKREEVKDESGVCKLTVFCLCE